MKDKRLTMEWSRMPRSDDSMTAEATHAAIEAGRVGAEEYERNERAAGNAVVWLGVSAGGPWDTPEDCADEEMSYWDDDGEG